MILFKIIRHGLVAFGILAAIVAIAIAVPVQQLPELATVSVGVKVADRSNLPSPRIFQARDGTSLLYRYYPAEGTAVGAAILIHGSSGSSVGVHPLARVLAARGIAAYAPDIRGHGGSGTRGDIRYLGQLDDDLADMVARLRADGLTGPISLIGHSSGGGFALRIAGSNIQDLFAQTFLLAPWMGSTSVSSRDNAGGWASPDLPRIIALSALRGFGIVCCDALPVIAFAVPPKSTGYLTAEYSMRLLTNFGATRDYRSDLNAAKAPITLIGAADDDLMFAGKYAEAVSGTSAKIEVKILDKAGHMAVVSEPTVMARVADIVSERIGK